MKKFLFTSFSVLLLAALISPVFAQDTLFSFDDGRLALEADPSLASDLVTTEYESTPYDANLDMPLWAVNPAFWEYELVDYPNGDRFFTPATISLYSTVDFEKYSLRDQEIPYGYGVELDRLTALLADQPDLSEFVAPDTNGNIVLPYLPLANAAQVFRAQPEYISFQNGQGVRYLTYYSQAVNPIIEGDIFYTFQGLTDDGSTYVVANFPVLTGIFPDDIPTDLNYDDFANNYMDFLQDSLTALDAQAGAAFTPSLDQLDALVESLSVNP